MKQVVQNYKTGELRVAEVPVPAVRSGSLLVKNHNSFISVGTEKLMIDLAQKSLLGKARERPDLVKKVMDKVKSEGVLEAYRQAMNRLDDLAPLGYSCAGKVVEVGGGAGGFRVGDRVACFGSGYASHAEYVVVPRNLCVRIPEEVGYEEASLAAIGAIALHGVRLANLTLGERVVVIGLGLLGQITVQILKASGCRVFGTDIDEEKVELARKHGMDGGCVTGGGVKQGVESFTGGEGADAVIITASTPSNEPIELAAEVAREKARVVAVGLVGLEVPRKVFFEKELDFVVSRGAGPGIFDEDFELRGRDYPLPYVRWTEQSNMGAFLELLAQGKVKLGRIITHRFDIGEAEKAYDIVLGKKKEKYMGIVLSYEEGEVKRKVGISKPKAKEGKEANVGLIGAGLFARSTMLPLLSEMGGIKFKGVSTATGTSGRHVAEKFGFEYSTTDYSDVLEDSETSAVIIATRHDLHARLVKEALEHGKDVFVEKPLAVTEGELREVYSAWKESSARVMVGFNRRFSPLSARAGEWLGGGPKVVNYRDNSGYIEREHWVHGEEGGGRIIGEVCHYVDLIQYLTGAYPVRVYAEPISGNTGKYLSQDNVAINMKMSDGSVGNIVYTAMGDKSFPRERVEVFGGGAVCIIDNFKKVWFAKGGKKKEKKKWLGVERGHKEELEEFFRALKEGKEMPVEFESYLYTTLATFRMVESLREGRAKEVDMSFLPGG